MYVTLNPQQWRTLDVDSNYDFVRAAFYLGMGLLEIEAKIKDPRHRGEYLSAFETAVQLGLSDNDVVVKDTRYSLSSYLPKDKE